jgi:hypothetical protein
MNDQDLKQWFFETLSEGGYSFVEFWQYARRNNIESSMITSIIHKLFLEGLIEFYIFDDGSYKLISDRKMSFDLISRFNSIVEKEVKDKVIHYIEIVR